MKYTELGTGALFLLHVSNAHFDRLFFERDRKEKLLTIAWNRGVEQTVHVDGVAYSFPANSVLPLMVNQSFHFQQPENLVAWQFNREFYCIVDHDRDVSCVGFLFYGVDPVKFLNVDETETKSLDSLLRVTEEEFGNEDNIQGEMLRMLLKRLIIKITRLARAQTLPNETPDTELDLVRRYNLAVENHFKTQHSVAFYAGLLNKSPKTLSNVFGKLHNRTPLEVVHERLSLEARRLLLYTDKSSKEIAYELGFEDPANFSRFFKKMNGLGSQDFKEKQKQNQRGKN